MAIKIGTSARNAACNGTTGLLNTGTVEIRTGVRPADPQTTATGTVLVTLTLPAAAFATAATGVATANAITGVAAAGSGTASWFRAYSSTAVAIIDGDVAVSASDMNIQNVSINAGQTVTITSWTHTQPQLAHGYPNKRQPLHCAFVCAA